MCKCVPWDKDHLLCTVPCHKSPEHLSRRPPCTEQGHCDKPRMNSELPGSPASCMAGQQGPRVTVRPSRADSSVSLRGAQDGPLQAASGTEPSLCQAVRRKRWAQGPHGLG